MAFEMGELLRDAVISARAAKVIEVADGDETGRTYTRWCGRKVVEIAAPFSEGAYSRTKRLHEMLHANKDAPFDPKDAKRHIAAGIVDDAIVHTRLWPEGMPTQADRDCLAIGVREARSVPGARELKSYIGVAPDSVNSAINAAVRGISIAKRLGEAGHQAAIQKRLKRQLGGTMLLALNQVVELAAAGKRESAIQLITKLLDHTQVGNDQWCVLAGGPPPSRGRKTAEPMKIVKLPLVEQCDPNFRRVRTIIGKSGPRLNRPMLARMIANKSTSCAFKKVRSIPGSGAVLIDGSGSMDFTEKSLAKLCRSLPTGTIGVYTGYSDDAMPDAHGCYGELQIFASNGLRARELGELPGGNSVDLFALQWLLKQPAPRFFVTDMCFCGGPVGQNAKAHALLRKAMSSGEVTHCVNARDAIRKISSLAKTT